MSTGEVKVLDSRFSGCIMIGNPFEIHEIQRFHSFPASRRLIIH